MAAGISIADFVRARRTFNYKSEFGDVPITYRPYQMTPAREAEIARMSAAHAEDETDTDVHQTEQGIQKIVLQFCEVVEAIGMDGPLHEGYDPATGLPKGRELVAEGNKIPIVPEIVKYFSSAFLVAILVAVAKDARPKGTQPAN
jgi:hypothetical protein